jgi:hypothetical protein
VSILRLTVRDINKVYVYYIFILVMWKNRIRRSLKIRISEVRNPKFEFYCKSEFRILKSGFCIESGFRIWKHSISQLKYSFKNYL